jgi:DNA (cytosine-5)-methyltransferase 1
VLWVAKTQAILRCSQRAHVQVFNFYEFFAGGGMVRAGLGPNWSCLFANDFDLLKAESYKSNFGEDNFILADVHELGVDDLPGIAELAWASFPCQDLSCAGNGLGIGDEGRKLRTRSGTFWPFIGLIRGLKARKRAPKLIVLENVLGLLATNSGADFRAVATAVSKLGYRLGAMVVDAKHFVPQSRPRLFIIGIAEGLLVPHEIRTSEPVNPWHPDLLLKAYRALPPKVMRNWIWFNPGTVPSTRKKLLDVVSERSPDIHWHTAAETNRLMRMMSPINLKKIRDAKRTGDRIIATLFLRMRPEHGVNRQRAEISFSDVAGCIRTPKGGGSRPRLLEVHGSEVRSRLLSPKEAATLMGLKKTYKLPKHYECAYRVIGDGVVVPAVAFIRSRILEPILLASKSTKRRRLASPRRERRQGRRVRLAIAREA